MQNALVSGRLEEPTAGRYLRGNTTRLAKTVVIKETSLIMTAFDIDSQLFCAGG